MNAFQDTSNPSESDQQSPVPAISIPKGGGAIRSIGEKFAANPVTGTGSMTIPIATSPARAGFTPQLALSYDSGAGNSPFGYGWQLSLPSITRKTDKGLPRYDDVGESDVYIMSGAEDLVPVLEENPQNRWTRKQLDQPTHAPDHRIDFYRPRIEGLFARIERWTHVTTGIIHWRSISKDNVTTIYGKSLNSRIVDPQEPTHIFNWLICESYDDKGNAIIYEYVAENSDNVDLSQQHERNRTPSSRASNRYLKRIYYGNRTPNRDANWQPTDPTDIRDWMFEVVFDYDEGHLESVNPPDADHEQVTVNFNSVQAWSARDDAFSSYRAGFDVRTYRLCRRVLMFHHFQQELGIGNYLVSSTELMYQQDPIASFITHVVQSGYTHQTDNIYFRKSLPPVEFEYSHVEISTDVIEVDADQLTNLPYGLDNSNYRWVDLDGEGISGLLTEQGNAWYYKANMGNGQFETMKPVAYKPSLANLNGGRQQLLDLAGDGQLDLALLESSTPGFYERTSDAQWTTFRNFTSLPNLAWNDPNLRFVDLTGDGHADILITEDHAFNWHESLAEAGYGQRETIQKLLDEEHEPRLIFADGTQSVYLADLSGDGLTDLVRIRNGEVCYWANLGYGHFGSKVSMDNAPLFDYPDLFNQNRVQLADIDGSGTTDIIYIGRHSIDIYRNQSGNSWEHVQKIENFPKTTDLSSVTVVDLLGNGTACLVWSSPMRYIDLMGGQKPHLMIASRNNMGAETRVQYVSSTYFYLKDKYEGKPWITRLSFPVHVIERIEIYDHVSRNRFVTRYSYHHGYFDGIEREFRGFGRVDQVDTEEFAVLSNSNFPIGDNINESSHIPPIFTRTWFHTGAFIEGQAISRQFQHEYYHEDGLSHEEIQAQLLPDTVVPHDLTPQEYRESIRTLKGSVLRQEVYALDNSGTDEHPYGHPYTVSEKSQKLLLIQPQEQNHHAVFYTCSCNTLDYHYERNPSDPRIMHQISLAIDEYGNVLRSASITYGRRSADMVLASNYRNKQTQHHIICMQNDYTHAIDAEHDYRTPLPAESRTYELGRLSLDSGRFYLDTPTVDQEFVNAVEIGYHLDTGDSSQKRLIEHVRTLYRRNDLDGALSLGDVESLALPYESYQLAYTPALIPHRFGDKIPANDIQNVLGDEGQYVDLDDDGNWWTPSGQIFYSPTKDDPPTQELQFARIHFFLPHRFTDPFGSTSRLTYDRSALLMTETEDSLENRVTVGERDNQGNTTNGNNYRVLQPELVTDPNRNRTQVIFDTLGMVAGTAIKGKMDANPPQGDLLDQFVADLTPAEIDTFFNTPDPHVPAPNLLQGATTRIIYDVHRFWRSRIATPDDPSQWQMVYAGTLARESHVSNPDPDGLKIQISFSYSDGFGREIQQKIQAEPGIVPQRDANDRIVIDADCQPVMTTAPAAVRWVGSGWTIFNNKGKPVRQYEPFFTDRHQFEFEPCIGVSPIMFYDPAGRAIATLHPNHTYDKVIFDPWQQTTYDINDTATLDPRTDSDVADLMRAYFDELQTPWDTWRTRTLAIDADTVDKTVIHADTPTTAYFDSLARPFLTIAQNKYVRDNVTTTETYETEVELDIEGNQRAVIDANGQTVMRYEYDMLGTQVRQESMDAGIRWSLNNVAGNPIYSWDSLNHIFHTEYDIMQRPLRLWVTGADPDASDQTILTERLIYGDQHPQAEQLNLRGQLYMHLDQAGAVFSGKFDFKGNPLEANRRLTDGLRYKQVINWQAVDDNSNALPTNPTTAINIPALNTALDVQLENHIYTISTEYDALNRATTIVTPDQSVTHPIYNEANLLNSLVVDLQGDNSTDFVKDIDYDARGQRNLIHYGNDVITTYSYDPETLRLTNLKSTHDNRTLQDLHYVYDPVGNITEIRDDAQQTTFFNNSMVEPHATYTYDAVYQLIEATGREHGGLAGRPKHMTHNDEARMLGNAIPHTNNPQAMQRYKQSYSYDAVGNFIDLVHSSNGNNPPWSRDYHYDQPNNRLTRTVINPNSPNPTPQAYDYDAHGNMNTMPHLSLMKWDYRDQLQQTAKQVTNDGTVPITYFVYDAGGQRIRKVNENSNQRRVNERIYLGGFEIFREFDTSDNITLERETLHIMDDQQRIALVETRTDINPPIPLIRYQFSNHLGSASLELDVDGLIISYEEYYPYGSTSYQAVTSQIHVSHKRYRYTGMERDDETGLNYHTARYYAPWLGRWISADPIGIEDGMNLYAYVASRPIQMLDRTGLNKEEARLGKKLERNSLEFQDLVNKIRKLQGLEPIEIDAQSKVGGDKKGRGSIIPDEVKKAPNRKQPHKVVELKGRSVHSKRNQNMQDRIRDIKQNLKQVQQQMEALWEEGKISRDAKGQVLRVIFDSDKGTSAKEALDTWREEAKTARNEWVDEAANPKERAIRQKIDVVTTTRDRFSQAVKRIQSRLLTERPPIKLYSGVPGTAVLDPKPSVRGTVGQVVAIEGPALLEKGAKKLGASDAVAEQVGFWSSVGGGAWLGAGVGAIEGGVGAIPGAVIGGAIGGIGYLSRNYELCVPFYSC